MTLGANDTVELVFDVTFEEQAAGVVDVAGVPAGELTVINEIDIGTPISTSTEAETQDGFGAFVALLGLLGSTLVFSLMRDGDD